MASGFEGVWDEKITTAVGQLTSLQEVNDSSTTVDCTAAGKDNRNVIDTNKK